MFTGSRNRIVAAAIAVIAAFSTGANSETTLKQMNGWHYAGAQAVAIDADRDLAFLGSGGVILVLDVSDPASPQLLHDGLRTSGHVRDLRYDSAEQRRYVADWHGGLEIWEVVNPQSLKWLSSLPVYYTCP